jgi:hypothetical protein
MYAAFFLLRIRIIIDRTARFRHEATVAAPRCCEIVIAPSEKSAHHDFTGQRLALLPKAQAPQPFLCDSYLHFLRMNLFVAVTT